MLEEKEFNIALTGHRPTKLDGYDLSTNYYKKMVDYLKNILYDVLEEDKEMKIVGHTGMALGADTLWTISLLDVREEYPERVKVVGHIPTEEQSDRWIKKDRELYGLMREALDREVVYSEVFPNVNWRTLMFKRNEGMVKECELLIAIYDGSKSGTRHAVNYAEKIGKTIKEVHPNIFRG